jgi:hypothetical protein
MPRITATYQFTYAEIITYYNEPFPANVLSNGKIYNVDNLWISFYFFMNTKAFVNNNHMGMLPLQQRN